MSKEALNMSEKAVLEDFVDNWKALGKTTVVFGDLGLVLARLRMVNGGIDRGRSTVWGALKRMPGAADVLTFGVQKDLSAEEKKYLEVFVGVRRQLNKKITFADAKALVAEVARAAKAKERHSTTIWKSLQRIAPDLVVAKQSASAKEDKKEQRAEPPKAEATPITAAVSTVAALKVLEDIRTIAQVMGKPADYLKPLDELLARDVERKDVAALEKKVKCLEDKLAVLTKKLGVCKKALRITCRIRQEAVILTKAMEEIKRQDGVDLPALISEEE